MKKILFIVLYLSTLAMSCTSYKSGSLTIEAISKDLNFRNSYLITTSRGTKIAIDPFSVAQSDLMVDAILITHSHYDHNDDFFLKKNSKAKKLINLPGELKIKGVKIRGIASSHKGDMIQKYPDNVIFFVEADGFKIAHLGDIGQSRLNEEQLKLLKDVDLVFMQYENFNSGVSIEGGEGVLMTQQMNPSMVVPTHCEKKSFLTVSEALDFTLAETQKKIQFNSENIPKNIFQPMSIY